MNPPVFALLSAATPVTAIVGTNPVKVFPGGEAPQGTVVPYVTYQIISGIPENYLSERPDLDDIRVQINCWGATRAAAKALYDAVQHALEMDAHEVSFNDDSKDPETLNWRHSTDFRFWAPH